MASLTASTGDAAKAWKQAQTLVDVWEPKAADPSGVPIRMNHSTRENLVRAIAGAIQGGID